MINTNKKYVLSCIMIVLIILTIFGIITYIYDPFFHYHKPYSWISYNLNYQRYQNDGILKHFDYDTILTGTSMMENTKSSELDKLFGVKSVKVSFAGASFKEVNDNLVRALKANSNVKMIIRSLDLSHFFESPNSMRYDDDYYPWYLYDYNIFNDVKYVFNKSIFFNYTVPTIRNTRDHIESTTFDDYSKSHITTFGKKIVDKEYERVEKVKNKIEFTKSEKNNITNNFQRNIIQIVKDNPNIDFYLFFPPYSIYYYDDMNQSGKLERFLDAYEYIVSMLVEYPNIHLYSFIGEYDVITNLDNYRDIAHYSEKINSKMLLWMRQNHDLITKENYQEHINAMRYFFLNYDYDSLFKKVD